MELKEVADQNGYLLKYVPSYPSSNRQYFLAHRIIAETILGKPLPKGAVIHHYADKQDNSKIVICENQAYHILLHMRTIALNESGNANFRKCKYCKQHDDPMRMSDNGGKRKGSNYFHKSCKKEFYRGRYVSKKFSQRLDSIIWQY